MACIHCLVKIADLVGRKSCAGRCGLLPFWATSCSAWQALRASPLPACYPTQVPTQVLALNGRQKCASRLTPQQVLRATQMPSTCRQVAQAGDAYHANAQHAWCLPTPPPSLARAPVARPAGCAACSTAKGKGKGYDWRQLFRTGLERQGTPLGGRVRMGRCQQAHHSDKTA